MTRLLLILPFCIGCGVTGTAHDSSAVDPPAIVEEGQSEVNWDDLLPNAKRPAPGVLSGGQPSLEQLEAAGRAGFKTVINLRAPGESGTREPEVTAAGMHYVALPIAGADAISEENARALAAALEEAEQPILLHCGSGNRVGALLALKAFHVDGKSAEEALQYGIESGVTGIEPVVRKALGLAVE